MKSKLIIPVTALVLVVVLLVCAKREQYQIHHLQAALQQARATHDILAAQNQRDIEFQRTQEMALAAEKARMAPVLREIARRQSRVAATTPNPTDKPVTGTRSFAKTANAGQATPLAAFETAIWATYHGDVGALQKILLFDAEAQSTAAKLFSGLPAEVQTKMQSPEYMTALLIEYAYPSDGTYQITWGAPSAGSIPDQWTMGTEMIQDTGQTTRGQVTMQDVDGNWRLLVPATVIARLGGMLAGGSQPLTAH